MSIFQRQLALMGFDKLNIIKSKKILVFGCGGVGGACIEALVRSGIENLTIIDNDIVSITNINRQIIALHSTIGLLKVEAMKSRVSDINPNCKVNAINKFINGDNLLDLNLLQFDYIVDAIDTISTKIALAKFCFENGLKLISSMGTGNRFDPTKFRITDINKTENDPLAKVMRYELRKLDVKKLNVLISDEIPCKINYEKFPELKTEHKNAPGSIAFVPPVAGMIIASFVIKELLE